VSRLLENDKSTREMASEYSLRAIVEQADNFIIIRCELYRSVEFQSFALRLNAFNYHYSHEH